ncbi:antitoxin Xre/MbcA/ParS toxin-binding domain-containing protein [Azospirillum sp. SYSU D00513]|uniref:antitoxin Xre/MbcA/ParS toxin-binding domain-containing protein n=1 Tax=Azospirillum sp. SYSU D00513 TaxID=2812561 RepID=UPI001A961418|nr:antitoxin Xre/MbcA/ParS toxin-binding domain-containing protein [Azospirillum sp. SYSU D00513]
MPRNDVAEVLGAAAALLGGDAARAAHWFRQQPLSGFDGRTAEELVACGHTDAVLAHLETLGDGGYA